MDTPEAVTASHPMGSREPIVNLGQATERRTGGPGRSRTADLRFRKSRRLTENKPDTRSGGHSRPAFDAEQLGCKPKDKGNDVGFLTASHEPGLS